MPNGNAYLTSVSLKMLKRFGRKTIFRLTNVKCQSEEDYG